MNRLHNEPPSLDAAFQRLLEIALVFGGYIEQGLAERGLTRARATVLWRLREWGPITQRALSELLQVTPRNVTGLVDALQADGFVVRRPHPTDRRATLVALTDRGDQAAAALAEDYRAGAAELLGGVPPADLAGFVSTIDQLLARLRPDSGQPPGSA